MKIGGGLNYVVGPMGAGKTLYGTRRIVSAVTSGQYAVTNIELRPGWEQMVANHIARFHRGAKREKIAARIKSLYVYETELAEARRYKLRGTPREGRALFMWDEGHNDLNNRKWKDDGRAEVLEWATQLRKLGYIGFLLSQHQDNTDAALRRVCNYIVKLQNQKEQTRMLGIRVTPLPLFLAAWYPAHLAFGNMKTKPVTVERYFLSWHKNLYDTFGLFHGVAAAEDDPNTLWLPDPGEQRGTLAKPETPHRPIAEPQSESA